MARACSSGYIHHCTCATPPNGPPNGNFKWGGCGDNFRWGMHFAKRFVDTMEKLNAKIESENKDRQLETIHERKLKRLKSHIAVINLHNNRVGRRVSTYIYILIYCQKILLIYTMCCKSQRMSKYLLNILSLNFGNS